MRLWFLHCNNSEYTTVLHQAIKTMQQIFDTHKFPKWFEMI